MDIQQERLSLRDLPAEERTKDKCYGCVWIDVSEMRYIPPEYFSDPEFVMDIAHALEMQREALEKCQMYAEESIVTKVQHDVFISAISYFKHDMKKAGLDTETIMSMLDGNPWFLRYVPDSMTTEAMCLKTIEDHFKPFGASLWFISDVIAKAEFMKDSDEESMKRICFAVIEKSPYSNTLQVIPNCYHSDEMYRMAVMKRPRALEFVPKEHRTEELCKMSVNGDGEMLCFVPEEKRTLEICRTAMKCPRALTFVPKEYRTEEFCRADISEYGDMRSVPEEKGTLETCRAAMSEQENDAQEEQSFAPC